MARQAAEEKAAEVRESERLAREEEEAEARIAARLEEEEQAAEERLAARLAKEELEKMEAEAERQQRLAARREARMAALYGSADGKKMVYRAVRRSSKGD